MNSHKIGGHPEQENLKLLSVVDSEINLTEIAYISEDKKEMINGTLGNNEQSRKI